MRVVLREDDGAAAAHCLPQLFFQLGKVRLATPQHMARVRIFQLDIEHVLVAQIDAKDAGYIRDEQPRDHRLRRIDLKIDRQTLLVQPVQDLCKTGRASIGGIQAYMAPALQLHR